jgi:hypothetical protein
MLRSKRPVAWQKVPAGETIRISDESTLELLLASITEKHIHAAQVQFSGAAERAEARMFNRRLSTEPSPAERQPARRYIWPRAATTRLHPRLPSLPRPERREKQEHEGNLTQRGRDASCQIDHNRKSQER